MCGIIGVYSKEGIDKGQVKKAADSMLHRGPDDEGYFFDDTIAFGHRRLSIIDTSKKGHQPMANKDESVWIIFNGEIYNFKELRKELEAKYEFKSTTDTEVILHAYEEWQENCVERLNGMFAFAIYDVKKKRLFLARDRTGVKPLYYYLDKNRFLFASEIKALCAFDIPKTLNTEMLYDYFNYFIGIGNETLLKGIKTVPPGSSFILEEGKLTARKYWNVEYSSETRTEKEWADAILKELDTSIQRRMIADVPIGAFLSGGVDSSAIVALMKKHAEKVRTFSVGSGDATELDHARFIAGSFNTEHKEILISADDFAKNLAKMVWHYDLPISFPSSVPLYFVSKLTKGNATVVLTGEGADELFAGYGRYRHMSSFYRKGRVLKKFVPFKKQMLDILSTVNPDPRYRKNADMLLNGFDFEYATGINVFFGQERKELLQNITPSSAGKDALVKMYGEKNTDFLNRLLYIDMKTYLVELLMKQDKMSMAASIESRVPFLDYHMIELAAKIPHELKLKGAVGKYILKKSLEKELPQKVIYQKKLGFPVPLEQWFRKDLKGFVQDTLGNKKEILQRFFSMKKIDAMIAGHAQKNYSLQLWSLMNFALWHEQFLGS